MSNEWRRDYDRLRWQRRRGNLVALLGGKCERCGSEDHLDFDHIDPKTKSFAISSGLFKSWTVLLTEVAKCQLLCRPCHIEKTSENLDGKIVAHGGGVSGKKNCPCRPCKDRKSEYMREWKRSHKGGSSNGRASGLHPEDRGSIPLLPTGS